MTVLVVVKHQGKRYEVELDPSSNGETFKFQLYSLTGVEPERQKILVKGGQLKDDTLLSSLNAKAGQTFMMMGTPANGESNLALRKPKEAIKFLEDMTEAEVAKADGATPAGLSNLGNTCYLNSTLQTLRLIPELQEELQKYKSTGQNSSSPFNSGWPDLTASLRDLYKLMSQTQRGFPPIRFLDSLRTVFPQFAQQSRDGNGYAQQDAEEAWSQIISQLRQHLMIKDASDGKDSKAVSFVDKYMSGTINSVLECDEQAAKEGGEMAVESSDVFFKLNCHIDKEINHLHDGIMASLEEKIEKHSPTLDRDAIYTKKTRISRLPKYLTVHFVRFFWKRESQKKAKIMRKVTFPQEIDVVDFCTDELKKQLIPVRDKVREIRKDEQDMERARKRQKIAHKREQEEKEEDRASEPLQKKKMAESATDKSRDKPEDKDAAPEVFKSDAEYEAEKAATLLQAKQELFSLINEDLAKDESTNKCGLYELRGVITHQGASADSGHYTAYVKKQGKVVDGKRREEDGNWWWFNDEKVSEVPAENIETLSGGGESHSALILLYKAIDLPTADILNELIHHGLQSGVQAYSRRLNPILPLRQISKYQSRRLTTVTVPPPGPNKSPRRLRILLSILLFGYLEPASPEDIEITTSLNSRFDQLEIVKRLREDPDYTEWEPYGNFTEEEKKARLTSGCLRGSRGLSCQHVFYNSKENILKSVLYLGNGLDGWPTVVHGGTIATILDENMGRLAIENLPERTGVTANLNISYKARLGRDQYIIIEAKYDRLLSSERKAVVEAVIKDHKGKVYSEAKALFVYPKTLKLRTLGEKF
ncbi:ubiquitin C-terminal hydrolase [Trichophyton rubrum]|uniref:Ubiquitin carboxyl-terminal hydrolase n=3 Tax=Trichophyton rubrum TaxID=5551 RepID=A0A178EVA2_TRIRU|nr:ubiquitin C-terminal hydrolase [Trichophyton rubrum]